MSDLPDAPIKITWKPAGPIYVEGPALFYDNAGDLIEPPVSHKHPGTVKLCGCGLSKTRPFCDGSHKR
jgi:CDGSH-type Zn-finger protein